MTQVLARKWRPRSFAELVGQEHVVRALTNALKQQRLHHAYLFTGTRGVGKTTLARIIARALNCETGITDEPCGKCGTCMEIEAGRFVDLVELDAASNTQVDNMRELLENALYAPSSGRFKVYIIDEVHMLSRNAFNAMLKTLEEPPPHVKFILATTDPQKIPVTVLSRCLQFNLKQIPRQQIAQRLTQIAEAEQVPAEQAALALIARAAQGSLRDALSLLDQAIAHGDGKVDEASTRAMLGTVDNSYLFSILDALAAADGSAMMVQADSMAARSLSFEAALQELAVLLHRIALAQQVPDTLAVDDPERNAVLGLCGKFMPDDVQLYYQIAVQGRSDIAVAPDEFAGFTMTLLRMLAFAPDASPATASRRSSAGSVKPNVQNPMPATAAPKEALPGTESWPDIVAGLGLNAMALMLAQNCEMVAIDAVHVELNLPKSLDHMLVGAHQARLKAAMQKRYGEAFRVAITLVEGDANSPAVIAKREQQEQHTKAAADIERDPFVRELVENFGGRVRESSIKPL